MAIEHGFILAAGMGSRMRPLTAETPKPLLKVGGQTMLGRGLDQLKQAGANNVAVNAHYLADQIEDHLKTRADMTIHVSKEDKLLDTGGGIKRALYHFSGADFFVLSGDSYCVDGPDQPALQRLSDAWDPKEMDILMLLQPVKSMKLTSGVGDYDLEPDGRAVRSPDQGGQYMFTSIRINRHDIFDDTPDGAFSYLDLMDRAQQKGRLYGLVHDGEWHHISTPPDLEAVNAALAGAQQKAQA